ncbi:MAG: 3-ketoacyl-ACP reductase [Balneolaceae bacterium]|nr:3-ketoacyl-ACP reductase [Balneolaceae bacterium]
MNPTAFVTGGSRGIGLAIAEKLCKQGYDIAINGVRGEESVQEVLADLQSLGTNVIYCQGDIGSDEDRKRIVDKLKTEFGRLNVLVNNAGVAPKKRLDPLKASTESFDRLIRINLKGPYFLTQAIASWMVDQKKDVSDFEGSIINIGSISATVVSPDRGDYCISKAGLAMHNLVWAVRLAEYNIPVYEVRPGVIRTDMTSAVTEKYDKLIAEGLTIQPRWGTPDDVAKAVLALVRGDFPYSSGEVIMVDGGLTINRL